MVELSTEDPPMIDQRSITINTPPTKAQSPATLIIDDSDYDDCETLSSASMDLDSVSDTESERDFAAGSECSGCTGCTPSSSSPSPTADPQRTISTATTTTKKQRDHEHGCLHWTACYETGCRYHRDEDKKYQPRRPTITTCYYYDQPGHKKFHYPDNKKKKLFQRLAPETPIAP